MADINLDNQSYADGNKSAMRITLTEDFDFRIDGESIKGLDWATGKSAEEILTALREANPGIDFDNARVPAGTALNIPEIEGLSRSEWFETEKARPILGLGGTRRGGRLFGDARIEGEEGTDYQTVSTADISGEELRDLISPYPHSRADAIAAYNGISLELLENILNGEEPITSLGTTIRIPLQDPFSGAEIRYSDPSKIPAAVSEVTTAPAESIINTREVAEAPLENFQPLVNAARNYYQARSEYTTMQNALEDGDAARISSQLSPIAQTLRQNNYDLTSIPAFDPEGYSNPEAARAAYDFYIASVVPREVELMEAGAASELSTIRSRDIVNHLRIEARNNTENAELTRAVLVEALDGSQGSLGSDNAEAIGDALEASIREGAQAQTLTGERRVADSTVPTNRGPASGDDSDLIAFINGGSYASSGVHLRGGLSNEAVERLQQTLHTGGFYEDGATAETEVDGRYGPRTALAVEALQEKYGLPKDGVIGPDTLAALQIEEAQQALNAGVATDEQKALLAAELEDIAADSLNLPEAVRDEARGLLEGIAEVGGLEDEASINASLPDIRDKSAGPSV